MGFGAGSGFGGGGGGARGEEEEPFRWFGPRGSGAFITPGEEWPLDPKNLFDPEKNKWVALLAVGLVLLALASRE